MRANTQDRSRIRQHVISGSLSGDFGQLFELPGGPVGFAIGGEYRKEQSRFIPDPIAAQGLTFTNALGSDRGSFDVKEVFGELNAPLLRNLPFAHRLEVGAAIRLSGYSTIGKTTTWKANGAWAPIRDITFNGTYSKAVPRDRQLPRQAGVLRHTRCRRDQPSRRGIRVEIHRQHRSDLADRQFDAELWPVMVRQDAALQQPGDAGEPGHRRAGYLYLTKLWQHDIYASIDATNRFQFFGGVNNVFGQKPEIGTDTYPVPSLGRYIFVGARVKLPTL